MIILFIYTTTNLHPTNLKSERRNTINKTFTDQNMDKINPSTFRRVAEWLVIVAREFYFEDGRHNYESFWGLGLEISLGGGSSSSVSRSFALSRRLSYFPYLFLTYDVLGPDLTQHGEALRVHARRFASVKKRLHTRVIVRIATPWQTNASSFSKAQPSRMCRPELGSTDGIEKKMGRGTVPSLVSSLLRKRVALFDDSMTDGFQRGNVSSLVSEYRNTFE